jgi:hypothetical protein
MQAVQALPQALITRTHHACARTEADRQAVGRDLTVGAGAWTATGTNEGTR